MAISAWAWIAAALLLTMMGGMMWRPIHEESATGDEPCILAAGYSYCNGYGFQMHPDEPPLAKMWSALPLLGMNLTVSREAKDLLALSWGATEARTWMAEMKPVGTLFPKGRDNWYFWPWYEGPELGGFFVFRDNNAERLLAAGRLMQVALTLLAGVVIFLWACEMAGSKAGVLALAMWCFNPVALAYGHLIQTDAGSALTIVAASWASSRFLTRPTLWRAIIAGAGLGVAVATKLSALLLLPTIVVLACLRCFYPFVAKPSTREWFRYVIVFAVSAYGVLLVVYAPYWNPPPPLADSQAAVLEIPRWFQILRPVLVPADFFKAVALLMGSARGGHNAGYLFGEWSTRGWWYYYPVAIGLKSPIAWLLLCAGGLMLFAKRLPRLSFEQLVPWVSAAVFLGVAMMNSWNIGIRHLLPLYALLPVGVAAQAIPGPRLTRIVAGALCGWMLVVALWAHPFYIEYFNEFGGGAKNGYRYLLDSNLDWGQDAKRLKYFLSQHGINHIYLRYFGVPAVIQYYGISNTSVTAEQAQQIHDGILVISVMELMKPDWNWLRQRQPVARVGYTLFVYQIGK
jgi:hypothetical protein